jgi:hypothetical protein
MPAGMRLRLQHDYRKPSLACHDRGRRPGRAGADDNDVGLAIPLDSLRVGRGCGGNDGRGCATTGQQKVSSFDVHDRPPPKGTESKRFFFEKKKQKTFPGAARLFLFGF